MRRNTVFLVTIVAAIGAAAMAAASASGAKSNLVLSTAAGVLPAGAEITASSIDLKLVTEGGNIECSSNIVSGSLTGNGAPKLTGQIDSAAFTGEEGEGKCKTTTCCGLAFVSPGNLPWPIEFTSKGTATIKKSAAGKLEYRVRFPFAGNVICSYAASKITGSFVPGDAHSPTPLETTISAQPFKLNRHESNPACPGSDDMQGHFHFTSGEEVVFSERM